MHKIKFSLPYTRENKKKINEIYFTSKVVLAALEVKFSPFSPFDFHCLLSNGYTVWHVKHGFSNVITLQSTATICDPIFVI
jgi:hypothetical protein